MKDDIGRLCDIRDALNAIERRRPSDAEIFASDELLQVWVLHHLQIVGEAASRLSEEIREKFPEVPWRKMIGMRNVIVHGYDALRPETVWGVVERDLETLCAQIDGILTVLGK